MTITIHRGTHEIGGTLIELRTESTRIMIDAGFPLFLNNQPIESDLNGKTQEELSAMGVLPPINGLYAGDERGFDAIIVSHAHIDHYGLYPWLHPDIPIYMSKGTAALIDISQLFKIVQQHQINRKLFIMYQPFAVGDITIKPHLMDHSAFDAAALEIFAEGETVLYTGDFRGHGRKGVCLDAFLRSAKKEADALLIEGTMLGRQQEQVRSEAELEDDFTKAMEINGPVYFQCSSQNIDRLVTIYKACRRSGRMFIIDAYTANVLSELRKLGNNLPSTDAHYPGIKVFFPYRQTMKIFDEIGKEYAYRFSRWHIGKEQISSIQNRICMMVRPSMLRDLAKLESMTGGVFIYSLWQGYRETPSQQKLEAFLRERGVDTLHLHSSGHASVPDLQRTIDTLRPKRVIPIHGFYPELFLDMHSETVVLRDGADFDLLKIKRLNS